MSLHYAVGLVVSSFTVSSEPDIQTKLKTHGLQLRQDSKRASVQTGRGLQGTEQNLQPARPVEPARSGSSTTGTQQGTPTPISGDAKKDKILMKVFQNLQSKQSGNNTSKIPAAQSPSNQRAVNAHQSISTNHSEQNMARSTVDDRRSGGHSTTRKTDLLPDIVTLLGCDPNKAASKEQVERQIKSYALSTAFYDMREVTKDANFFTWAEVAFPYNRDNIEVARTRFNENKPTNLLRDLRSAVSQNRVKNPDQVHKCMFSLVYFRMRKTISDKYYAVASSRGVSRTNTSEIFSEMTTFPTSNGTVPSSTGSVSYSADLVSGSAVSKHRWPGTSDPQLSQPHILGPANLNSSATVPKYSEGHVQADGKMGTGGFLDSVRRQPTQNVKARSKPHAEKARIPGKVTAEGIVKRIEDMRRAGQNPFDPFYCLCHQFDWETLAKHIGDLTQRFCPHVAPKKINSMAKTAVSELMQDPDSISFHMPVDPVKHECPDYYEKVGYPIDLGTIKKRAEGGYYKSFIQVRNDIDVIWENALTYNGPDHVVGKAAQKMREKFHCNWGKKLELEEQKYRKSTKVDGRCSLCFGLDLEYQAPQLFCNLCDKRVRENSWYYTDNQQKWHICVQCFKKQDGEAIKVGEVKIECTALQKKKNSASVLEPWVQCDICGRWQHMCCSLFNGKRAAAAAVSRYDNKYACPNCTSFYVRYRQSRPDLSSVPMAKKLPSYDTDAPMEEAVNLAAEQKRRSLGTKYRPPPVAEVPNITVRLVANTKRSVKTGPVMYSRYGGTVEQGGRNYPREFNHRLKGYTLWQNLGGVDTLLFCMYVQEFGQDAPLPNRGSAYLSYLDTVKYFEPQDVRTTVYHELLIAYLRKLRERGFNQLILWACPPKEGDDYIIYCHPQEHRTPKDGRLQSWYLSMLEEAQARGIVERITWLADDFWPSASGTEGGYDRDITQIPNFEGDYWPRIIEDECKEYTSKALPGPGPTLKIDRKQGCIPEPSSNGNGSQHSSTLSDAKVAESSIYPKSDHVVTQNVPSTDTPGRDDSDTDGDFLEDDDEDHGSHSRSSSDPMQKQDISEEQHGHAVDPPPPPPPPPQSACKTPRHTSDKPGKGKHKLNAYSKKPKTQKRGREVLPVGSNGTPLPKDPVREKVVQQLVQNNMSRSFIVVKLRPSCQVYKHYIPVDEGYYKYIGRPSPTHEEDPGAFAGKHPLHGPDQTFDMDYSTGSAAERAKTGKKVKGNHKKQHRKDDFYKTFAARQQRICCLSKEAWNLKDEELIEALGNHPVAQEFQRSHFVFVPRSSNSLDLQLLKTVKTPVKRCESSHEGREMTLKEHSQVMEADKDINNDIFITRQLFLDLCRNNNFQFDQLRRAKHSSMMILHHLHNPDAPAFVHLCNNCQELLHTGSRWTCKVCEDVDYCRRCKETANHPHELIEYNVNGSIGHLDHGRDTMLTVVRNDEHRAEMAKMSAEEAESKRDQFISELERAVEDEEKASKDAVDLLQHVRSKRLDDEHMDQCDRCNRYRLAVRMHARRKPHQQVSCDLPFCNEERKHINQEREDRCRRAMSTYAAPIIDRRLSRQLNNGEDEDEYEEAGEEESGSSQHGSQEEYFISQSPSTTLGNNQQGGKGYSASLIPGKAQKPALNGPTRHPLDRRSNERDRVARQQLSQGSFTKEYEKYKRLRNYLQTIQSKNPKEVEEIRKYMKGKQQLFQAQGRGRQESEILAWALTHDKVAKGRSERKYNPHTQTQNYGSNAVNNYSSQPAASAYESGWHANTLSGGPVSLSLSSSKPCPPLAFHSRGLSSTEKNSFTSLNHPPNISDSTKVTSQLAKYVSGSAKAPQSNPAITNATSSTTVPTVPPPSIPTSIPLKPTAKRKQSDDAPLTGGALHGGDRNALLPTGNDSDALPGTKRHRTDEYGTFRNYNAESPIPYKIPKQQQQEPPPPGNE